MHIIVLIHEHHCISWEIDDLTTPIGVCVSLIPPTLLLLSGYFIQFWIPNLNARRSFLGRLIISLLIGSTLFIIPYIIIGMLQLNLSIFVSIHFILTICLTILTLLFKIDLVPSLRWAIASFMEEIHSTSPLPKMAIICYSIYSIKVSFQCFFGPIISGDAFSFWISMSKVFFNMNAIPEYDPYHFVRYSAEPLIPALYSWGFFILGSTELEVFRGVSVLFFMFIPLVAYEFAMTFLDNRESAYMAAILITFLPILDYMIFLYSFYADMASVSYALISLLFLKKAMQKRCMQSSLLSGIALALCILSKYGIGLLTGFAIAIEILICMDRSYRVKILSTTLIGLLLIIMAFAADTIWKFSGNIFSLFTLLILVCAIVLLAFNADSLGIGGFVKLKFLFYLVLGFIPAIVWATRCALIGAAPFGIVFLRVIPPDEGQVFVSRIIALVNPLSSSANRFTLLSPIGFIFHPLVNGFLSTVMLIRLNYSSNGKSVIRHMLFYYLGYITIMGYFPSGRHMLMASILLMVCISGARNINQCSAKGIKSLIMPSFAFIGMFAIFSLFQLLTLSVILSMYDLQDVAFQYTPFIPHTFEFGWATTPELVIKLGVGSLIVLLLSTIIAFNARGGPRFVKMGSNSKKQLITISILSMMTILPVIAYSLNVSQGNIWTYDFDGSWNKNDIQLELVLREIISKDTDIVLTYGDLLLSYNEYKVIDLYREGLYVFPAIINSTNIEEIYLALSRFGVRFVILPNNKSYLWPTYQRFISIVSFPELLVQSNYTTLLFTKYAWRIYSLL